MRIRSKITSLLVGVSIIAGHVSMSQAQKTPDEYAGKVVIWTWAKKAAENIWGRFNQIYPKIKLELVEINVISEYVSKFKSAQATGEPLPDIVRLENQYLAEFLEMDLWERLDAPPYNLDPAALISQGYVRNAMGHIVAVQEDDTIGGLAYNRKLAKEYFGTDDPAALEAMFPTWEAFIAKGREVKEKSQGEVYMFASLADAYRVLDGQSIVPLIAGNTLNFTETLQPVFTKLVAMRDAGIVDRLKQWSPEWNQSFSQEKHIFYGCPAWFPFYVIQQQDPDGAGRWGLMMPPEGPLTWGGTALAIPKRAANKELAWTYLAWALSLEGAIAIKESAQVMMPVKALYENPESLKDLNPWFGGQDIGQKLFHDLSSQAKGIRPPSKHLLEINDTVEQVMLPGLAEDNSVTLDQALTILMEELQTKLPGIEIK